MPHNNLNHDDDGSRRDLRSRMRGPVARRVIAVAGAMALALGAATPALASTGRAVHPPPPAYRGPIKLVVVPPGGSDVAGAGGVFNIDLAALAQNAAGDRW